MGASNNVSIAPILTNDMSVQDLGAGGVLNQLPSLKETAEMTRKLNTKFNEYKDIDNQGYSSTHPNSQSDGDEWGRGETGPDKGVGTSVDQQVVKRLLHSSGNKFSPGSGYYAFDYPQQYW